MQTKIQNGSKTKGDQIMHVYEGHRIVANKWAKRHEYHTSLCLCLSLRLPPPPLLNLSPGALKYFNKIFY